MGILNIFKKKNSLDFSEVDNREKVQKLCEENKLVPFYLMPLRFGGVEDISNCIYTPIFANKLKERYDNIVEDLLKKGKVSKYSAKPQYKGKSFVPSSITITASGESTFTKTINIW